MRLRMLKGMLLVGMILFMGTTASAWVSGTSTTQTRCTTQLRLAGLCSIEVEGLLKGLGNVNNNPTAFAVDVLIEQGYIVFRNPAGNSGEAEGVPFLNLNLPPIQGAAPVNANQVSKNGRALSDVPFHDDELIAAVEAGLTQACLGPPPNQAACDTLEQIQKVGGKHSNWIKTIVITKLQVLGQQWIDPDTTTSSCDLSDRDPDPNFIEVIIDPSPICQMKDALGSKCDAPQAVKDNPAAYVWQAFTYGCTESCHNTNGTQCPDSLPLP